MRRPSLWTSAFIATLIVTPQLGVSQQKMSSDARDVLRRAATLIPDIPEPQQMSVASNIANTQARAGDLPGALSTVLSLKNPYSQTFALGSVAYSVDHSGDLNGALKLIDAAADDSAKDTAYQQIAGAHAERGDFSPAFRVAHLIKRLGSSVGALNMIAKQEYRAGEYSAAEEAWDEAREIADRAGKSDPNLATLLVEIAGGRGEVGETAAASGMLKEVSGLAQSQKPVNSGLLSTVAMGYAQIGDIASAVEITDVLPPDTNRDTCLMIIAEHLMKQNETADAQKTASKISDPQIKTIALKELAITQAGAGAPASAVDTTREIPTTAGRAEALASLAYEEAENNNTAAAATVELAYAAANQDPTKTPPYVFSQIAVTRAILGDFDTAEDMTWRIPSGDRWWPLESIAGMLVNSGDLNRALKLAEAERDAYPRACALLGIANALLAQAARSSEKP